ncbi:MAG TPA: preprotein translocase subunit YajC [Rhodanobacteraceae bacterium]|nr:preprotein translocase subunit YajC [Rhodanobacteraceae bacterium]
MDFLISAAQAQTAGAAAAQPAGGGLLGLLPLLALGVVFYFMLIRPQSKRMKEHRKMLTQLAVGDEVITNGGVAGRVQALGESFTTIEVASGVQLKVQKQAISQVLPKGTLKSS